MRNGYIRSRASEEIKGDAIKKAATISDLCFIYDDKGLIESIVIYDTKAKEFKYILRWDSAEECWKTSIKNIDKL